MKSACRNRSRWICMPGGSARWMSSSVARSARVSSSVLTRRLFLDADDHGRLRVVRTLAALDRRALAHDADVADQDRRGRRRLDGDGRDGVDVAEPPDAADQILLALRDLESGRGVAVRLPSARASTSSSVTSCAASRAGSSDDLVLLLLAAGGDDLRDAGHGEQAPPDHRFGDGADSSGEWRSDSRSTNRTSPMIDETGARNGGSTPAAASRRPASASR